jgi:hypothetical protein
MRRLAFYRRQVAGRAFLTVTMTLSVLAGVPSGAAMASTGIDLICPGFASNTYSPGITFTPQQIHVESTNVFGPCVSLSHPNIASGGSHATSSGTLSCVVGSLSGSMVFQWNTGENSSASFTAAIVVRPGGETVGDYMGTITGGVFNGDTFNFTATIFNTVPLQCLSPGGITGTAGPLTLELLDM